MGADLQEEVFGRITRGKKLLESPGTGFCRGIRAGSLTVVLGGKTHFGVQVLSVWGVQRKGAIKMDRDSE